MNEMKETKECINTKAVLTFQEACAYTGFGASYLYKLTSTGQIPHYKPTGKMVFFNRVELEGWLMRNRVAPQPR